MANSKPPDKRGERPRRNVVFIDLRSGTHDTVVDPTLGATTAREQRRIDEGRSPTIVPDGTEEPSRPARQPRRPTVSGVGPSPSVPSPKKK